MSVKLFSRLTFIVSILLLLTIDLGAERLKEVVVLNSYHQGFKWTSDITDAIADEFNKNESYRLFYEYLDSKRFNDESYFVHLKDIYHYKYSDHKIDGIICSDNKAFDFYIEYGQSIWGDAPAVFCGVNNIGDLLYQVDTLKHTIVHERIDIFNTLKLIHQLQPQLEEIIVISDKTLSGNIFLDQFVEAFDKLKPEFSYRVINNAAPDKLHTILHELSLENKAIYLLSLYTHRNGIPNEMTNEVNYFFKDINLPIYSNWDFLMPDIIVGGKILRAKDQGQLAAQLMKEKLSGQKPATHNWPVDNFIIDQKQADKYALDLSKSDIPFVLTNQEQSFISQYKKEVMVVLLILITLTSIVIVLVGDVIKRKRVEINFIESEKRLELAIDGANEGLWDIHLMQGSIFISEQFAKLLNYNNSASIKMTVENWTDYVFEQDVEQVREAYNTHKQGRADAFKCETRLIDYSGNPSWFSLHGKITEWKSNEPSRITGIILNINDQKAFEEQLQNAKEKAEESDRLKSSFLANMSHEIRTPMNAILGFTDLLIYDSLTSDERSEYLNMIKNSGENLLSLINDIIDISKVESGELSISESPIDFSLLANEVYNVGRSISNSLNKNIELRLDKPENDRDMLIIADPLRLYQVMLNLMSNAIKFTDSGYVELSYKIHKDHILSIRIKDTGPGISDDYKELIFDRFRQIDESTIKKHGGTGLGLSITKSIILLMNGHIEVVSDPPNGAEFIVEIPVKLQKLRYN